MRNKLFLILTFLAFFAVGDNLGAKPHPNGNGIEPSFSQEHIAAINRKRRIIVNFDTISGDPKFGGRDPAELVEWKFHAIDTDNVQIDSVWWGWGEGHQAPWPSKTMPLYDQAGYRKWVEDGVDIVQVFLDASKERGIEAFYNYRLNGGDNDLGPFREIPMKKAHPDWLIRTGWQPHGYWNFAIPGVRDYKLSILREIAERYDFDGISLDFARGFLNLPTGHQWENRNKLTDFMRAVRSMTQEVASKRGRPLLIGARIPENLEGCHFDGMDIETWIREQLVDVLAPGVRSFDVDLAAFQRLTVGTHIKLYPSIDDHHASDGYQMPPVEIYRGMAANWWHQGADGIQTFNFNHAPDAPYNNLRVWKTHILAYQEIGSPKTLERKDKVFFVQRRGGGHGPTVVPDPEDWRTPRLMYFNTNMFAPLPVALDNDAKADTLLMIAVADDVAADAEHIEDVTLRMILHDSDAGEYIEVIDRSAKKPEPSDEGQIERALIRLFGGVNHFYNSPPVKGIEKRIEVRINNVLLAESRIEDGWLVFYNVDPNVFAVGSNLLGVRVSGRSPDTRGNLFIEKLEVHVNYR